MHLKSNKRFEPFDADGIFHVTYHPPNGLSREEIAEGLSFIRQRFLAEWQIQRDDVTEELLQRRGNLRLLSAGGLAGWLGIEDTGELENGCIDVEGKGASYLARLIRNAYECWDGNRLFAYVPVSPLTSAHACLAAGMQLHAPPDVITRRYPEKAIRLVRLHNDKPFGLHGDRYQERLTLARIAALDQP